ncbi:amino acid-binding protein [Georgenia sp. AZ-5]|uniref:amino acid-binding protein n=1 Tax=Georgenia sp. AZ-5 TaxID=3367526 RepID=UPI00375432E3
MSTHGTGIVASLRCEVCGQLPHPRKTRLTLANVAAVLPIELVVHSLVVDSALPHLTKVLLLTITATVLAIWVAEPSVMRLLRAWLHAPTVRARRRLESAHALWRVRTAVPDAPGALEGLAHALAGLGANVLDVQVQPLGGEVLDEFVVAAPDDVTERDLVAAVAAGGGSGTLAWPTTALALADSPTRALNLSVRVAAEPAELPFAVAELLGAEVLTPPAGAPAPVAPGPDGTVLKVFSPWSGAHYFTRPGRPFTTAESARAHRLAQLAEVVELRRTAPAGG